MGLATGKPGLALAQVVTGGWGNQMEKRAQAPSSDSAQILPPCFSTISLQTKSPSPVPLVPR